MAVKATAKVQKGKKMEEDRGGEGERGLSWAQQKKLKMPLDRRWVKGYTRP